MTLPPDDHELWQQQQQLERNRSKLCILHHAATCPYQDTAENCPLERRCCAAKRLFVHINGCGNSIDCDVPGCKHSRAVWKHYRKCRNNTPEQHAACPVCSAVPAPYNPADLCDQFRLPPATAELARRSQHGGDSMVATMGSRHPHEELPVQQLQRQQSVVEARPVGRPPRRTQSMPTSTSPTTLASKQAMAKLKGSIIDDGTVLSKDSAMYKLTEEELLTAEPFLDAEKENSNNHEFPANNNPRPPTTTVPGCVMDAFGTLWGGNGTTSEADEPSFMPHYATGRNASRYHSLDGTKKKSGGNGGFLSLRRTRSREEAAQPMISASASSTVPTDEEEDHDGNWRGQTAAKPTREGRRESRMRRMQLRFMT